jgi:hypothetical protein
MRCNKTQWAREFPTAGAKVFCNKCIIGCSAQPFVCKEKNRAEKELCRTQRHGAVEGIPWEGQRAPAFSFYFLSTPCATTERQLRSQFCAPRHPSAIFSAQTLLFIKSGLSSAEWITGTWTRRVCFRLFLMATNKKSSFSWHRKGILATFPHKNVCPTGTFFSSIFADSYLSCGYWCFLNIVQLINEMQGNK